VPIVVVTAKSLTAEDKARLAQTARTVLPKGNPTEVLDVIRKVRPPAVMSVPVPLEVRK
jgi:hypothetical protein